MEVEKDIITKYHLTLNDEEYRVLMAIVAEAIQTRKKLPEGTSFEAVTADQLQYWFNDLADEKSR